MFFPKGGVAVVWINREDEGNEQFRVVPDNDNSIEKGWWTY